jgi:hypothetical protein
LIAEVTYELCINHSAATVAADVGSKLDIHGVCSAESTCVITEFKVQDAASYQQSLLEEFGMPATGSSSAACAAACFYASTASRYYLSGPPGKCTCYAYDTVCHASDGGPERPQYTYLSFICI